MQKRALVTLLLSALVVGFALALRSPPESAPESPAPAAESPADDSAQPVVESCMECHVDADGEGGRLFGLPDAEEGY